MNTDIKSLEEYIEPVRNVLIHEVPVREQKNDLKDELSNRTPNKSQDLIKNVNNQVLIDILSPEISKNEGVKRIHKYVLIILLAIFLCGQFFSVCYFSNRIISYAISDNPNTGIVNNLLAFISAYITSVIVELIAILNYIVKNVFDTSLAELVKLFKENDNKE